MKTRAELKAQAKQQISGNIGMYFVCTLIISAISSAASFTVIGSILLAPPLSLGLITITLGMTRGEKVDINNIFSGFSQFGPSVLLSLLVGIFTFLWSLLFYIPGIIKGLSYSMSFFILSEHPEMTASEALDESKRIMDGHKMDLFVLYLSFFPWMLLITITFGLAAIYVGPYMSTTIANFYNEIKGE